jgi:hypothetical protein
MKKNFMFLLAAFTASSYCFSQDTIVKKAGGFIEAKVIEITNTEVKYKNLNNIDGPLYTIEKTELLSIRYQNGTQEVFGKKIEDSYVNEYRAPSVDWYKRGQQDAHKYYFGKKSGAGGTLAATLVCGGCLGLIPAIATSSSQPQKQNLMNPQDLDRNQDYMNGYTKEAHRIKRNRIWTFYGIGVGINLAVALFIIYQI